VVVVSCFRPDLAIYFHGNPVFFAARLAEEAATEVPAIGRKWLPPFTGFSSTSNRGAKSRALAREAAFGRNPNVPSYRECHSRLPDARTYPDQFRGLLRGDSQGAFLCAHTPAHRSYTKGIRIRKKKSAAGSLIDPPNCGLVVG